MPQHSWTREEDMAVLCLRVKHNGQLRKAQPDVVKLAKAMSLKKVDSILMRNRNFDNLDKSSSGEASSHVAKQTKEVWAEYKSDPDRILAEARKAYLNLIEQSERED